MKNNNELLGGLPRTNSLMELTRFVPASDSRNNVIDKSAMRHYGAYLAYANRFGYINFFADKPFVYECRYYPNKGNSVWHPDREVKPELIEIVSLGENGVEHFEQDKNGRVNIVTYYDDGTTETVSLTRLAMVSAAKRVDSNEKVAAAKEFKRSLPQRLRDYLASGLHGFRRAKTA